jgi:nitrate reductase delta subunit
MIDGRDRARVQQVCSLLLRYPDDALLDLVRLVGDVVSTLPPESASGLTQFLDYLNEADPMEAQKHYVETFDMRRKCSPYLTYWTHGDTRNRGMALLHFKQVYRELGLSLDGSELPDHLAVVLEFAANDEAAELGNALLAEHRGVIALLHSALDAVESPYAHVVSAVLSTTSELTPEDEQLMQRLASSGPPTESVGMAGPIDLTLAPYGVDSSEANMGARR